MAHCGCSRVANTMCATRESGSATYHRCAADAMQQQLYTVQATPNRGASSGIS
jgi:hypothetical protein